jgi:hypothetical protein
MDIHLTSLPIPMDSIPDITFRKRTNGFENVAGTPGIRITTLMGYLLD